MCRCEVIFSAFHGDAGTFVRLPDNDICSFLELLECYSLRRGKVIFAFSLRTVLFSSQELTGFGDVVFKTSVVRCNELKGGLRSKWIVGSIRFVLKDFLYSQSSCIVLEVLYNVGFSWIACWYEE